MFLTEQSLVDLITSTSKRLKRVNSNSRSEILSGVTLLFFSIFFTTPVWSQDFIARLKSSNISSNIYLRLDQSGKSILWVASDKVEHNGEQYLNSGTYFHTNKNRVSLNTPFYNPFKYNITVKTQLQNDPIFSQYDSLVNSIQSFKIVFKTTSSYLTSTIPANLFKTGRLSTVIFTYDSLSGVFIGDTTVTNSKLALPKLMPWEFAQMCDEMWTILCSKKQNAKDADKTKTTPCIDSIGLSKLNPIFNAVEGFFLSDSSAYSKLHDLQNMFKTLTTQSDGKDFFETLTKIKKSLNDYSNQIKQFNINANLLISSIKRPESYLKKTRDASKVFSSAELKRINFLLSALSEAYKQAISEPRKKASDILVTLNKFYKNLNDKISATYDLSSKISISSIDYYKLKIQDSIPDEKILKFNISFAGKGTKDTLSKSFTVFKSARKFVGNFQPGLVYLFQPFTYNSYSSTNGTITSTQNSAQTFTAAFFNIYSTIGDDWYLMLPQVGFTIASPTVNNVGAIFTGGGLSYKGTFTLSFGASFFFVKQLNSDLKVGAAAPSDALSNHMTYSIDKNHSAYVSLNIRVFKKAI